MSSFSVDLLNLVGSLRQKSLFFFLNERLIKMCMCVFFCSWMSSHGCQIGNWLQQLIGFHVKFALPERASLSRPSSKSLLICTRPPQRQTDGQTDERTHTYGKWSILVWIKRGGGGWGGIIVLTQLALRNWSKSMPAGFMCSERPVDTAELNTQHTHKNKTPNQVYPHKHTRSVECRHTKLPWAP